MENVEYKILHIYNNLYRISNMYEYVECVEFGWLQLLALVFGHMSIVRSICDMKSFCVIQVSLAIHRWNVMSEGHVCMRVCVCMQ